MNLQVCRWDNETGLFFELTRRNVVQNENLDCQFVKPVRHLWLRSILVIQKGLIYPKMILNYFMKAFDFDHSSKKPDFLPLLGIPNRPRT